MTEGMQTGPGPGDDGLNVEFFYEGTKDEEQSATQGRPVFRDVEFIRVSIPGDKSHVVEREVRDIDKVRWPALYRDFKSGRTETRGMPLRNWMVDPPLKPSQIKELEYHGVRTVEMLAGVSDGNLSKLGMYREWRDKARLFVKDQAASAPVSEVRAAAASQAEEIAQLRAEVERLTAAKQGRK
jgi:hypothetical protein